MCEYCKDYRKFWLDVMRKWIEKHHIDQVGIDEVNIFLRKHRTTVDKQAVLTRDMLQAVDNPEALFHAAH